LADHSASLSSSLNNLAALTDSLAQSNQQIAALVKNVPGFTGQLATVLNSSTGSLGCVLDALGQISTTLSGPNELAALQTVLDQASGLETALNTATAQSPIGEFLHGSARINVNGPPIPLYATAKTLPGVPTVPSCPSSTPPNATGPIASTGAGGSAGVHAGSEPVPVVTPHHGLASSPHSPTTGTPASHLLLLALIIAAIVLALLALIIFRPWRLLVARRVSGSKPPHTPTDTLATEATKKVGGTEP
jgi:hypothetical protein